jgi:hypothetical protein
MSEQQPMNFNINDLLNRVDQLERYAQNLEVHLAQEKELRDKSNRGSIKVTLPETYDGDTTKLGDWLFQVKNYVALVKIPVENQVNFLVALLRGTALSWWRLVSLNPQDIPRDIQAFETLICQQFQVEDEVKMARDLLAKACQKGSVHSYTTYFRSLLLKIKDISEAEAKDRYIRGLKPRVQQEVILRDCKSLAEIIRMAERFDSINQSLPKFPESSRLLQAAVQPDAMDIDMVQIEEKAIELPSQHVAAARVSQGQRSPLSDSERRELARNRACFYCRQPGHFKQHCPSRPVRPVQGNGVARQ